MGDGRIFLKIHRASLFNDDLLNEPNLGQIHLVGQYLLRTPSRAYNKKICVDKLMLLGDSKLDMVLRF